MTGDAALQLVSNLLWVGLLIAAPILLSTMLVGVLVSIFQAVTQIQEASLSFIPKIITVIVVMVALGPWMLKRLLSYSSNLISGIPGYF